MNNVEKNDVASDNNDDDQSKLLKPNIGLKSKQVFYYKINSQIYIYKKLKSKLKLIQF